MKGSIALFISLLASAAIARPRAMEEGDPLPQKSRVTAFTVSGDGTPSVECWEIDNMVDSQQVQRLDGSKGTARMTSLADPNDLDGIDILTWPSYSPIWPDPQFQAEWYDLGHSFSLFSVQGGLVHLSSASGASGETMVDDAGDSLNIFSLENGDDWFYFEDQYTGSERANSVDAPAPPFQISTISGSDTEVLRLRFNDQPKHTILHKGACSFTGISTPAASSNRRTSRVRNPLVQQYRHSAL